MSEEDLLELITSKLLITCNSQADKKKLQKKNYSNFRWKAAQAFMDLPAGRTKKDLAKIVREYRLYDTELYLSAKDYEQVLKYLPQYYPELNPIERYWCLLKKSYYDTDANLDWEARLELALSKISDEYIQSCFSKSLDRSK